MSLYQECDPKFWQGRTDGEKKERVHQTIIIENLDKVDSKPVANKTLGLLGFACDEGVARNKGRRGAAQGPDALRSKLAPLCTDYKFSHNLVDFGNVSCDDSNLESAQSMLKEKIAKLIAKKVYPIVIGGGHETAWGHFLGLLPFLKNKRWGIINFDAHFDLRPISDEKKGSSGTPFKQIADLCAEKKMPFNYLCISIQKHVNTASLFQKAQDLSVNYILADQIHQGHMDEILKKIKIFYHDLDYIYLSICLDSFSAEICPGVSAPQVRGIQYHQFLPLFKEVLTSNRVCSADIVELSPPFDLDQRTAKFAASIALDLIQETSFASLK
ncbi:MAG: formimidoylglutamase [Oligoflexales bacterium]